jgi:hypothetical protein
LPQKHFFLPQKHFFFAANTLLFAANTLIFAANLPKLRENLNKLKEKSPFSGVKCRSKHIFRSKIMGFPPKKWSKHHPSHKKSLKNVKNHFFQGKIKKYQE